MREPQIAYIPYGHQSITASDIDAVVKVLQSDWLTCGPAVTQFENALCHYTGSPQAIAVCNGTAALHLALKATGIGSGDRVITSANTFLASANAAEMTGATADFADIDPSTLCISTQTLEKAWKPDVKAVVAVDFAGYPCATKELADFVHSKGAILIEDACHAIGGKIDSIHIGGCPWVDFTIFSFHPVKTITSAEGGAILTANEEWAEKCRCLRTHGMQHHATDQQERPYSMEQLGYNYRISDLHCALGFSQLQRLDQFVDTRREVTARYMDFFQNTNSPTLTPALCYPAEEIAWHLFVCRTAKDTNRDLLRKQLAEQGIGTQIHYYPVHLQPYYQNRYGYTAGKCPEAEKWFASAISLPLFPNMKNTQFERILEVLHQITD